MAKTTVNRYSPILRGVLKVVMFLFVRIFDIKAEIPKAVKELKPPFLLLSNHIGLFDPFVIGYFLKPKVQFVSSDAVFHNWFMRWFLGNLGVIKKKKNIRDTQMIRDVFTVIKTGTSVGIFPEGTRSWTGKTLPIDGSIGKLAKLLNVPVVCVRLKGMHLFNPRWFPAVRKTKVFVEYKLTLNSDRIKALEINQLTNIIRSDLFHDEVEFQREKKLVVQSNKRAEFINHVLFICPDCNSIGQLFSHGNSFGCTTCGTEYFVNPSSFFVRTDESKTRFENIRDWFAWQNNELEKRIEDHFGYALKTPLFFDDEMVFFEEEGEDFKEVGLGRLSFFIDRIVFANEWVKRELYFKDIQTISPQLKERIELFHQSRALRIVGKNRGVAGVKWEIAANTIWRLTGEGHKISTYFNPEL